MKVLKKITAAVRQESWCTNQCILFAKNSLGYCLNHCHSLLSIIIQHEYKGLWWPSLMVQRLKNQIVLILFWYIPWCFSVSQTTKIHRPTQHFNVAWYCAMCFSSHEPSSGTSYYNSLQNTSTFQHANLLLVRSHQILATY